MFHLPREAREFHGRPVMRLGAPLSAPAPVQKGQGLVPLDQAPQDIGRVLARVLPVAHGNHRPRYRPSEGTSHPVSSSAPTVARVCSPPPTRAPVTRHGTCIHSDT